MAKSASKLLATASTQDNFWEIQEISSLFETITNENNVTPMKQIEQ